MRDIVRTAKNSLIGGKTMKRIFIISCISLLLACNAFAERKGGSDMKPQNDINAILSCFGYGYKVSVTINGVPTSIKGGKSESMRLFNQDNEMAKSAPPEMKKLFMLKPGENQIQIEYKKEGTANDKLTLSLELEGYPAPVFLLYSAKKPSGKVTKSVILQKAVPQDFKPVFISDEGENKSAFVHVSTMDATITPILNNVKGMTLAGMPGSIPLEGVKPGKNELVIKYKADPSSTKELKFAVITPEWKKFITKKITDPSEKEEKFTFNVK
ncbi:MAG: hypothetical protein A2Y65_03945 [Deltaproteobacteria bacterium RBG_13_52_11]|nr:MAG: hypothetical protein A2Y65_03945 [Deltaproteobacteria bacterium RBG_13_52_11]